tara:strand:- start:147 stop:509 length:363 start_codon:yes stop_codon:yes gene_type:complete
MSDTRLHLMFGVISDILGRLDGKQISEGEAWAEYNLRTARPEKPKASIRRFILLRVEDVSGSSGTGIVARGVVHQPSGWTVLFWEDSFKFFSDQQTMMNIHAHPDSSGVARTRFHWQDKE